MMSQPFFTGSASAKLDEKNRVVLSQEFRYGLVEEGKLEFAVGLGLGGCLAIYRKSEIAKMAAKLRAGQHQGKYQKFLTLFFSTLHMTDCDKVGRFTIPQVLKQAAGIKGDVVFAGVLDKIEIWPQDKYERNVAELCSDPANLAAMMEEALNLSDVPRPVYERQEMQTADERELAFTTPF